MELLELSGEAGGLSQSVGPPVPALQSRRWVGCNLGKQPLALGVRCIRSHSELLEASLGLSFVSAVPLLLCSCQRGAVLDRQGRYPFLWLVCHVGVIVSVASVAQAVLVISVPSVPMAWALGMSAAK